MSGYSNRVIEDWPLKSDLIDNVPQPRLGDKRFLGGTGFISVFLHPRRKAVRINGGFQRGFNPLWQGVQGDGVPLVERRQA